ncbi:MAG: protein kinase, partial [Myxococcales bacterium]|nr:protein kinase [Myxococcales bacterium]
MSSEDEEDTPTTPRPAPPRVGGPAPGDGGPPRMFGPYRALEAIGRGGMGAVYRAQDTRGGEIVAIKVLYETDARGLARLSREFRRMADISHPNLVGLYELGSAGQRRY